jgi:hypothetical protein
MVGEIEVWVVSRTTRYGEGIDGSYAVDLINWYEEYRTLEVQHLRTGLQGKLLLHNLDRPRRYAYLDAHLYS